MKIKSLQTLSSLLLLCLFSVASACCAEKSPEWRLHQFSDKPSLRSSAIKDGVIWVAGTKGAIYKSLDKGQNWLNVSLKGQPGVDIRDIHAFNKNTVILMSVGEGNNSKLYTTTDAGANWHVLYQNTDEKGFFDSIDFWDNKNGLLLGDPVDGNYVIERTTDGGKNWIRIKQDYLPKILKNEAAFAASGNTLIAKADGKAWYTTGGFSASIVSSTDFGETWIRQTIPLHDKTQTAGGYGIAMNNQSEVFVVGGDYLERDGNYNNAVVMDTQGNWVNAATGNKGLRTAMVCVKATCIITGKLGSDISYDNGHSWQAFHTQGFYTLATENNTIIAAGTDGQVGIINF